MDDLLHFVRHEVAMDGDDGELKRINKERSWTNPGICLCMYHYHISIFYPSRATRSSTLSMFPVS